MNGIGMGGKTTHIAQKFCPRIMYVGVTWDLHVTWEHVSEGHAHILYVHYTYICSRIFYMGKPMHAMRIFYMDMSTH